MVSETITSLEVLLVKILNWRSLKSEQRRKGGERGGGSNHVCMFALLKKC